MNLTIKNSGSRKFPYYRIMNGNEEFCATSNFDHALKIIKVLSEDEDLNLKVEIPKNTLDEILQKILELKGIDLKTNFSQKREIVNLRFIYCKMATDMGFTLEQIGGLINRNYVNVLQSVRKFNNYYETEQKFRELYHEIKNYEL
jgi:hypothetical protein